MPVGPPDAILYIFVEKLLADILNDEFELNPSLKLGLLSVLGPSNLKNILSS